MRLTYLAIDLFSLIVPLVFSFHPRIKFYLKWKYVLISIFISAIPFLTWDAYFTDAGVWGFNELYLTGYKLFNLPVEEVLFFFCIPYSCLFTYHCFKILLPKDYLAAIEKYISLGLLILLLALAVLFYDRMYTIYTTSALIALILYIKFKLKHQWLSRFYFAYLVLLIPFTIVNGILTGTGIDSPVVWYNNSENMGIRLLTIPFEDIFYGMLLIMLNTTFYEALQYRIKEV